MTETKVLNKELFYNNQKVRCFLSKYNEPTNNAIIMVNDKDEQVAVCSTNLDLELSKNEVFIKNYSENTGMLNFLIKNGVVKAPKKCVNSGFAMIPICELITDGFVATEAY